MPSRKSTPRIPSYRRHKPSGQAVVTLNGRDIYLGKWNTKASKAEYERLAGAWLAGGRCLPSVDTGASVAELALAYWRYAQGYYGKGSEPTGSLKRVRVAVRTLRQTYGTVPARDFGPLALQAIDTSKTACACWSPRAGSCGGRPALLPGVPHGRPAPGR